MSAPPESGEWLLEGKVPEDEDWFAMATAITLDDEQAIRWVVERVEYYGPPTRSDPDLVEWTNTRFVHVRIRRKR